MQCNKSGQIPEQLLKKKYLSLFIGVGNFRDTGLAAESNIEIEEISSGVEGCDVVDQGGLGTEGSPFSDPPLVSKELTITSAEKLEDVGFICTRCNQHCISFTRLTNGTLVCTKCRYKS